MIVFSKSILTLFCPYHIFPQIIPYQLLAQFAPFAHLRFLATILPSRVAQLFQIFLFKQKILW